MPLLRDLSKLVLGWLALSAVVNLRYPASEPAHWYFIPSLDVTLIFFAFASSALLGFRVPRTLLILLACLFVFLRLFRVADGVSLRMQQRPINVIIDGRMLPDLATLAYTTVPTFKLLGMVLGGVLILGVVGWFSYRLLKSAARALSQRRCMLLFSALVLCFTAAGAFTNGGETGKWRQGAYAASVVPRFADDFAEYWSARAFPDQVRHQVQTQKQQAASTGLLAELRGTNVLLMFIESYGMTLLEHNHYKEPIARAYKTWEASLQPAFHMASTAMESPTVGGYSWFAHLTLATGIKVTDQLRYKKLYRMKPKTIVHYFVEAGYDTLVVQPATMRDPGPLIYPFARHRYSWEFGYQGRNFSWAPMPDQFALDFVYRNEIVGAKRPLFVEYNLVSGHMPWNDQADIVDWDSIQNGAIFRHMQGVRFDTDSSNLKYAHPAYLRAMLYDLEVLRQYIARFVQDDSLLILLGDHQPVGDVTGNSESRGVPVHIVSRNPRFVAKFVERGYSPGMRPQATLPYRGMETFLQDFISDFSRHE